MAETNKKQTAVMSIMGDIKSYVKSLNTPENEVYKNNELLILSCFNKATEICESKLNMEREQIENAYVAQFMPEVRKVFYKNAVKYYEKIYGKK